MIISEKDWANYISKLSKLSSIASDKMQQYVDKYGFEDRTALIDYAYALSTKYGEAAATLAADMYDAVAEAENVIKPAAIPAPTATYGETAKAINGAMLQSPDGRKLRQIPDRLVKQAAADTAIRNAKRDNAEWAWIPKGITCAFCLVLGSQGWLPASRAQLHGEHASHIHANCDCEFAIRFNKETTVAGYDPKKLREMYDSAGGNSTTKMRALRRELDNANKGRLLSATRTDLLDEIVGKSVGAKYQNYDIMDLVTGEKYHFAEGTRLQNKEVFAGKGSSTPYRKAEEYAAKHGGNAADWQHVKAFGVLDTPEGQIPVEVHWSQCEGIGKYDFFVKHWLE